MSKRIEILLVEDNTCDAELAIRALKKQQLANGIFDVKDGKKRSSSFSVQALTQSVT